VSCLTCSFENPPGQRFCGNCGSPLEPAASPSEERRLVTILFADVTGSTALGEALDPEDVRALFARYYVIAKDVVTAHGGTLAKFIGDAVMAVFGLPQAHGDDAQRALSAALALRDRVHSEPRLGERLPIRLGVNTGEVVATRDPSLGEFLLTGDAVNVAARLEQAADSWAILCGERTARAAAGAFEFGPLIGVEAKGKSAPIRAASLLGRTVSALARRIPLVGRESDLAHLELIAGRVFAERRPFLVSLIAPAGTGKTRLLEEFLDRLPALVPEARVAIAQCLPYGERLTYGPLRSVLHCLAGVADDSSPEVVREALRGWLERHAHESPERTAELLAATIGLGEAEVTDRTALFTAWRSAIGAASRRSPLVLVFEDLHWSSDSLLDLVEYVIQPRGDSLVLMIALTRPELLDRRTAWGGGRRNYVSLVLEPLEEDAVGELVAHLLGRQAPEIVSRVVTRAEGNPFYVGEIVRSVMDRVPSLDDTFAVERALATLPDTVQATVLARLDLLERSERRVLQLGSVFGRAFGAAGLAALEPDLGADVERLAERLVGKDLIRPADGDGFTFRHILIRELAYQTLPRAERWRLHAAAGRWLEQGAGGREEPLAELIAYHYHEAATLAGALELEEDEVGEIRRKAVHWLGRAADVATAAAALGEAGRHLRGAIELGEPQDLPELYERLGHVGGSGGDISVEAYRTALRLYREGDSMPDRELSVLARLLMLYTRFQGSVYARPSEEEMARLRAEGQELIRAASDEHAKATFLIADAFLPFWHTNVGTRVTTSELSEAEASAQRGLEIVDRLDDARLRSAALDALTSLAQARGSYHQAREFARQRLSFQHRLDLIERLDAYSMVMWTSVVLGHLDEAVRVSSAGLALLQPGKASSWALHLLSWRTYALMLLGRWDEASEAGESARRLWIESSKPATTIRGFIAALDVARGRRHAPLIGRNREVLDEMLRNLDPKDPRLRMRPYLTLDLDSLETLIVREFGFSHIGDAERCERVLALCTDHGRPPSPDAVRPIAEFAVSHGYAILEAQARRALGVGLGDLTELTRALAIFERVQAAPYAARSRCERALLTADEAELGAGLRELELLGDLDQLERMERSHSRERSRT
jgi:class 3 adenylate cyclase